MFSQFTTSINYWLLGYKFNSLIASNFFKLKFSKEKFLGSNKNILLPSVQF